MDYLVTGPAGRPDMAPWLFTEAIMKGEPIKVFNHGKMQRDFAYIDDIVEGVFRIQDVVPSKAEPYSLYNIGNNQPVELSYFIETIEQATGKTAEKNYLDMQPGDVPSPTQTPAGWKPQQGTSPVPGLMRVFQSLWHGMTAGRPTIDQTLIITPTISTYSAFGAVVV